MSDTQLNSRPMTVGDWIVSMIVAAIPLVGFVMLLVWGFGSNGNVNRKSWAQATLIFVAIAMVLYFFVFAAILSAAMSR